METTQNRHEIGMKSEQNRYGPQVLDVMLKLAAPNNQGALGDLELLDDALEGPVLGAQFDEPVTGLFVMHTA